MRQIKIQKVIYPGKTHYIKFNMYAVYLGNDSKNYFSNLKDAKQFVVVNSCDVDPHSWDIDPPARSDSFYVCQNGSR